MAVDDMTPSSILAIVLRMLSEGRSSSVAVQGRQFWTNGRDGGAILVFRDYSRRRTPCAGVA